MSKSDIQQFTEIEVLGATTQHDNLDTDTRRFGNSGDEHSESAPHTSNDGGTSGDNGKRWIWILLLVATALLMAIIVYHTSGTTQSSDETAALSDPTLQQMEAIATGSAGKQSTSGEPWSIVITEESVNDVPMTLYSLRNLKAELLMGCPDMSDTTIVFATQAADIRKDNNEIVGDFVLRGRQLTKGKRKVGYCAIINNRTAIGMSDTDAAKDLCIENGGDFFRQYILVFDGEAQVNQLRGKSVRRALVNSGDSLFIVTTHNRESLYDFSLALQDLGMTNALYLVGGDSYYTYRTPSSDSIHGHGNITVDSPHMNYLVFRRR